MQLFIDWKVATNHWKTDCSIHGSWTPTAQHRTGPRHHDENLHEQPYVPDGRPTLYISPSRFIQTQYWFHHEGEVSPTWSQEEAGGRQRTPGTVTQSRTRSSAPALAYLRARTKGTRHLSTQSRSGSTFPLVDSQADNAPMKICHASAMKVYVWGLSVYTESTEPAVQELIWLKALLQCRGCPELPGRIHRWCFFCGSSLAVYFADEQEERERRLQIHLSRLSK